MTNEKINNFLAYVDSLGAGAMERYTGWRIKKLKKKADKYREKSGTQCFVVKVNGRLRVLTKREFKWKRQRGIFPKNFTADELKKISYYHTRV